MYSIICQIALMGFVAFVVGLVIGALVGLLGLGITALFLDCPVQATVFFVGAIVIGAVTVDRR